MDFVPPCLVLPHSLHPPPIFNPGDIPANASMDDLLEWLYFKFKRWCSSLGFCCSIPRFNARNINCSKSTTTCLYKCKASKSPKLVAWLASITREYLLVASPQFVAQANYVAHATYAMAQYFYLLKSAGYFFTCDQRREVDKCGHLFLYMYAELARDAMSRGIFNLWHLTPKFHQYHHLILDSVLDGVNPSYFHCFSAEDMVGQAIILTARMHPATVVSSSMQLYRAKLLQAWGAMNSRGS